MEYNNLNGFGASDLTNHEFSKNAIKSIIHFFKTGNEIFDTLIPIILSGILMGLIKDLHLISLISKINTFILYYFYKIYIILKGKFITDTIYITSKISQTQLSSKEPNYLFEPVLWYILKNAKNDLTDISKLSNNTYEFILLTRLGKETKLETLKDKILRDPLGKMSQYVIFKNHKIICKNSNQTIEINNFSDKTKKTDTNIIELSYETTFNNYTKSEIEKNNELLHEFSYFCACEYKKELEKESNILKKYYYDNTSKSWIGSEVSCKKNFSTVILKEDQKLLIQKKINIFLYNIDKYIKRGNVHKLHILLYGCPGTGKSSLISAISTETNRSIYNLNLSTIKNDIEFKNQLNSIPNNKSIIIIEDIDHLDINLANKESEIDNDGNKKERITIPFFASFLDGTDNGQDRIIIITTNDYNKIDKVLLRPGRIDLDLHLNQCNTYQIKQLFNSYFSIINKNDINIVDELINKIPENIYPPSFITKQFNLFEDEEYIKALESITDDNYKLKNIENNIYSKNIINENNNNNSKDIINDSKNIIAEIYNYSKDDTINENNNK